MGNLVGDFIVIREGQQRVISSEVPEVTVSDPVVQGMFDEVSKVLRGVDDRYFPRIVPADYKVQGEQYLLFYVAEGKGFKIEVICGTDGRVHKVLLVFENSKKVGPHDIPKPDTLREFLDEIGSIVAQGRR